jgi:hypothetical protein
MAGFFHPLFFSRLSRACLGKALCFNRKTQHKRPFARSIVTAKGMHAMCSYNSMVRGSPLPHSSDSSATIS